MRPANDNLAAPELVAVAAVGGIAHRAIFSLRPAAPPALFDFVQALARRQARIDAAVIVESAANDNSREH
jgi:hypothetical protein